jgi:hypothetical protein
MNSREPQKITVKPTHHEISSKYLHCTARYILVSATVPFQYVPSRTIGELWTKVESSEPFSALRRRIRMNFQGIRRETHFLGWITVSLSKKRKKKNRSRNRTCDLVKLTTNYRNTLQPTGPKQHYKVADIGSSREVATPHSIVPKITTPETTQVLRSVRLRLRLCLLMPWAIREVILYKKEAAEISVHTRNRRSNQGCLIGLPRDNRCFTIILPILLSGGA